MQLMKNSKVTKDADEQEPGTALVLHRNNPDGLQQWDQFQTFSEKLVAAAQAFFGEFVDDSETLVANAESFTVDSQVASQTADLIQDDLKKENKEWNEERLSVTRSLDALGSRIIAIPKPGIENRTKAIGIYQVKISAFRAKVRAEEQAAQREAERLLAEEKRRLEDEARKIQQDARAAALKREEEARKLKTEAGRLRAEQDAQRMREEAADEAARLREQAEILPGSVAVATAGSTLSASTTAEIWEGDVPLCDACQAADKKRHDPKRECTHCRKLAVQTLLAKWDEWGSVIEFRTGSSRDGKKGMNDMAAHYKDSIELPGFRFRMRESFRAKPQGRR